MSLYDYLGPPRDWIGGVLGEELEVSTGRQAAMIVSHLIAYPAGLAFRVTVLTRSGPGIVCREALEALDREGADSVQPYLHIGVKFSDGRSTVQNTKWIGPISEPAGFSPYPEQLPPDPARDLMLSVGGSEMSEREFVANCWAWPLPPAGTLGFDCGWPAGGIPMRRQDINVDALHMAAERAEPLWKAGAA